LTVEFRGKGRRRIGREEAFDAQKAVGPPPRPAYIDGEASPPVASSTDDRRSEAFRAATLERTMIPQP
jgi:hypothetical protein